MPCAYCTNNVRSTTQFGELWWIGQNIINTIEKCKYQRKWWETDIYFYYLWLFWYSFCPLMLNWLKRAPTGNKLLCEIEFNVKHAHFDLDCWGSLAEKLFSSFSFVCVLKFLEKKNKKNAVTSDQRNEPRTQIPIIISHTIYCSYIQTHNPANDGMWCDQRM